MAAVAFGTGLGWGLPSRDADPFLFAGRVPWTGAEVMRLAGPWSPAGDRGSDRPQHAADPAEALLNGTDADRAEIVRRYRLYSEQPDEMITFRALSRMRLRPFDLDPRLYQYGGLWIYPIGGLLRLGGGRPPAHAPDRPGVLPRPPEAFGRFYVVARLYSAAWGLVGVVVVYGLGRELTGRTTGRRHGRGRRVRGVAGRGQRRPRGQAAPGRNGADAGGRVGGGPVRPHGPRVDRAGRAGRGRRRAWC